MDYEYILNNCLDEREFRNFVGTILTKNGFTSLEFDDVRLSDKLKNNNNDIIVYNKKDKYTIQTYLNKTITTKEVEETIKDMEKEKVKFGIIITNTDVDSDLKDDAKSNNIEIWDKNKLLSLTKKY